MLRAKWTFVRTYLLQRGFLDGWHGLVLGLGLAHGTLTKYVKLWQIGRRNDRGE